MSTEAAPAPIAEDIPIDDKAIEAMFRRLVGSVAADKDAKILQLKTAILKIKAAVDAAVEAIDLEVSAAEVAPEPAPTKAVASREEAKPKPKEAYSDRGEDTPLLVDLSKDLDAKELLEKWATGAHHIRYKIAEHLVGIGHEIEADTLLLRGEASDMDLMAARQVVQTATMYAAGKDNEIRLLRGCIEKLFGKF